MTTSPSSPNALADTGVRRDRGDGHALAFGEHVDDCGIYRVSPITSYLVALVAKRTRENKYSGTSIRTAGKYHGVYTPSGTSVHAIFTFRTLLEDREIKLSDVHFGIAECTCHNYHLDSSQRVPDINFQMHTLQTKLFCADKVALTMGPSVHARISIRALLQGPQDRTMACTLHRGRVYTPYFPFELFRKTPRIKLSDVRIPT